MAFFLFLTFWLLRKFFLHFEKIQNLGNSLKLFLMFKNHDRLALIISKSNFAKKKISIDFFVFSFCRETIKRLMNLKKFKFHNCIIFHRQFFSFFLLILFSDTTSSFTSFLYFISTHMCECEIILNYFFLWKLNIPLVCRFKFHTEVMINHTPYAREP